MKRLQAYFSGSVQGVGFRYTARSLAKENGLVGWVKNLPDGRVELLAEGEEQELKAYLGKLKRDIEPYRYQEELYWLEPTGEFVEFSIRF